MLVSCQPAPLALPQLLPKYHSPTPQPPHASSSKTIIQNGTVVAVEQLEKSGGRPKTYLCTYEGCGKAYTRPTRLEEHIRSHTGERPFKCSHCPSTFLRDSHLKAHSRTHQKGDEGKKYDCDDCEKKFWTNQHLKKHREVVHDSNGLGNDGSEEETTRTVKIYTCPHCAATTSFKKHKLLRNHISLYHPSTPTLEAPAPLPFVCTHPDCSKSFTQSAHLKSHSKTHDRTLSIYFLKELPADCNPEFSRTASRYLCSNTSCLSLPLNERQFPTWSLLQKHSKEIHPPTCPHAECQGRRFTTNRGLKGHLEVHRLREAGIKGERRRKRRRQKDSEEEDTARETETDFDFEQEEEEGDNEEMMESEREERLVNYVATAGSRKGKRVKIAIEVDSPWKCKEEGCRSRYKSAGALENHVALKHSVLPPIITSNSTSKPSTPRRRSTTPLPAATNATATEPKSRVSLLDFITGHNYAPSTTSPADNKNGPKLRKHRCPYPQVLGVPADDVLGEGDEEGSPGEEAEEVDAACAYRFSRVYDVERHLKSAHRVLVERDALEEWFGDEREAGDWVER